MKIFHTIFEIKEYISFLCENQGTTIGFVPTMGALHKGHIALIEKAKNENTICVCSIFVNPKQFDNKEDLEKYPRLIESDIEVLEKTGCDILFAPSEKEVYPEPDNTIYDLCGLDKSMEGTFRPSHFNGVAVVVKKLFDIVKPHKAYFGEKDFQQLTIIKYFVKKYNIPAEIIACPTIREPDGLAMSSRNLRLTAEERKIAPIIYQNLLKIKNLYRTLSIADLKKSFIAEIEKYPQMKVEYIEIINAESLKPVKDIKENSEHIICTAVYLGKIRLIDNIKIL